MTCSWRRLAIQLGLAMEESRAAADTGSLVHLAAAHWHKEGQLPSLNKCFEVMREGLKQFPLGDIQDAKVLFSDYYQDEKNKNCEFLAIEQEVTFRIPPAKSDKTQKEIVIKGHCDQIRLNKKLNRNEVWDLKSTKYAPSQVFSSYIIQLAAYGFAAEQTLKIPIDLGGWVFLRQYGKKNPFYRANLRKEMLLSTFTLLAEKIALIRNGVININPGEVCLYCWATKSNGVDTCSYLLDRKKPLEVISV